MGFEVLLYTDCAAHESVSGRTGFQFMAESSGITPTDEEFVKNGGLHVVASALRSDEPDAHPQTCTYREQSGRRYLSRGRSIGQTLSGRPGNQITQAIVSIQDADVLPLRPAQLYSCPEWHLERAATKQLDPWQSPLEIAPDFETSALHEMVTADPWARNILPAFLTMVEHATAHTRTKLIIRHSDQATVMRWIALASLLLDSGTALALTFRVFSTDPTADPLAIVGAHPLLSPGLTARTAAANNQNLIDIEAQESTPITVSQAAAQHARWFLVSDPYEALNAIATSDRWSRVLEPGLAASAAALVCLPEPGPVSRGSQETAAAALTGLADTGVSDELDAYGDELVDVVAAYAGGGMVDPGPAVRAGWALDRAGQSQLAGAVFIAVLEWAAEPAVAIRWARLHVEFGSHPSLRWTDDEQRAYAASLVPALFEQAEPSDLPALFTVAKVLDTGVEAAAVVKATERLAIEWMRRPELTEHSVNWLHRSEVVGRLRQHLAWALNERDPGVRAGLSAGQWDWLAPVPWEFDRQDPVAIWLGARVLAKAPTELRHRLLVELSPAAPGFAWPLFLTGEDLEFKELILWIRDHPCLDGDLAQQIERLLVRDLQGKSTGRTRELLAALADRRVSGLTDRLVSLVGEHRRLAEIWREALRQSHDPHNRPLRVLGQEQQVWLQMYRPMLANAMIDCQDRAGVFALTDKVHIDKSLENQLLSRLKSGDVHALVGALILLEDGRHGHEKVARHCLAAVWTSDSVDDKRVVLQLRNQLPADWRPRLTAFEKTVAKGRVTRNLTRGARTIFGRGGGSN